MKLLCFSMLGAIISALGHGVLAAEQTTPTGGMTTGSYGYNLNGKMVTLSNGRGEIYFFPPNYPWLPPTASPSTTITASPTTTASPTRGVSLCLRYLTDDKLMRSTIFTLSPFSRTPLTLACDGLRQCVLTFGRYGQDQMFFIAEILFWPNIRQNFWTRICLTVDTMKNVAQIFSGAFISIRKILPIQYVWSGEPVVNFSGWDGQVTDVHVWDYPLSYNEIFYYMSCSTFKPFSGSILTWSYISYSLRGNTLLEDSYENQSNGPQEGGTLWERQKKKRRFFNMVQSNGKKKQQV